METGTPRGTGLPPGLLEGLAAKFRDHYGARYRGLVLYGSRARGDWEEGSDVDLLLLLDGDVNAFTDFREIGDISYPFELEHSLVLPVIPVGVADYEAAGSLLLLNARRDAVHVRAA